MTRSEACEILGISENATDAMARATYKMRRVEAASANEKKLLATAINEILQGKEARGLPQSQINVRKLKSSASTNREIAPIESSKPVSTSNSVALASTTLPDKNRAVVSRPSSSHNFQPAAGVRVYSAGEEYLEFAPDNDQNPWRWVFRAPFDLSLADHEANSSKNEFTLVSDHNVQGYMQKLTDKCRLFADCQTDLFVALTLEFQAHHAASQKPGFFQRRQKHEDLKLKAATAMQASVAIEQKASRLLKDLVEFENSFLFKKRSIPDPECSAECIDIKRRSSIIKQRLALKAELAV